MNRFHDHTILVTGASSGIGLAAAERLASEGAAVRLVARDGVKLQSSPASLHQGNHQTHVCDTTDEAAVTALFKELKDSGTILNGVVHAAGIHWLKPLQLTDSASVRQMLSSHVESALLIMRAAVNARVLNPQGSSVVLLSSVAALKGSALSAAYAAAKGALISAARSLAVELASRKIRVNVVAPGVVRTPQADAWMGKLTAEQAQAVTASHPLGISEPADVAAAIAFLLSPDARVITGTTLVVDGGLSAK